MRFNLIIKKLISYFLNGLALILPIAFTAWIVYYIVTWLNDYMNWYATLVGAAILIAGLIPLGYLASSVLGIKAWRKVEQIFYKAPLLGLIYKAVKDVVTAFIGRENKFSEPVRVEIHSGSLYKIGFITNKEVIKLLGDCDENKREDELFLVYFPISFSVAGDLYLVPRSRIRPINKTAKDIMQTLVSGGIINMK